MAMPTLRREHLPPLVQSLADEAYTVIRRRIIECVLAPGQRFTESQFADEHNLGKTPVREALRRLKQEGLVEVNPRQGHRVSPIRLRDVRDIFGLRRIIEPAAVELAIGRIDIGYLRNLDAQYQSCYLSDPVAAFPLNTAFHLESARASGNARLMQTMTQLLEESERLYIVGFRFREPDFLPAHKHSDLIDAFETGNTVLGRQAVIIQIDEARDMVIEALLHSPALLEADVVVPAQLRDT